MSSLATVMAACLFIKINIEIYDGKYEIQSEKFHLEDISKP